MRKGVCIFLMFNVVFFCSRYGVKELTRPAPTSFYRGGS